MLEKVFGRLMAAQPGLVDLAVLVLAVAAVAGWMLAAAWWLERREERRAIRGRLRLR